MDPLCVSKYKEIYANEIWQRRVRKNATGGNAVDLESDNDVWTISLDISQIVKAKCHFL